jgi:hypothetical protein
MCCIRDMHEGFKVREVKWLLPTNRVCTNFLGSTYGRLDKGMGSVRVKFRVDVIEKMSRACEIFWSRGYVFRCVSDVTGKGLWSRSEGQ